jgi:putative phage-type endonuclease
MTTPLHTAPGINPAVAELVLPPGPNRAEWLATRRTGIGGSDISTLVGISKYSPYMLWLDKTGQLPLIDDNPSEEAEMGHLLEPVLRDRFARVHGLTVSLAGTYRSRKWPWMLVNPDGLVSDGAGLEIKTTTQFKAHDWKDGQTADHAELQANWAMAVTGLDFWHVAALIGGQRNLYRVVERDDDLIEVLVDVGKRFWVDHVKTGTAPDWDGSDDATRYLAERYGLADPDSIVDVDETERDQIVLERDKTAAGEKAAKADADALKNRIRDRLGTRERLMCGDDEIATWKNTGAFSEKKLRANHPELADQYTRPVTVDRLDVDALATDHPDIYRACRPRVLNFKN